MVTNEAGTRKRWTAKEASQVLRAWRASGMSLSAFARTQGLNTQRLLWWKKRLADWGREDLDERDSLRFVPAVVRQTLRTEGPALAIRLPVGVVVEVADTATVGADWLLSLIHI